MSASFSSAGVRLVVALLALGLVVAPQSAGCCAHLGCNPSPPAENSQSPCHAPKSVHAVGAATCYGASPQCTADVSCWQAALENESTGTTISAKQIRNYPLFLSAKEHTADSHAIFTPRDRNAGDVLQTGRGTALRTPLKL